MLETFVSKSATSLAFFKKTVHNRDVTTESNWTTELKVGEGLDVLFEL